MRRRVPSFRKRATEAMLTLADLVRRVDLDEAVGGIWRWLGYEDDDGARESDTAPVYGGIGIYARPAAGDRAEAVLVHIGGSSQHPALAALRNEDARRRYVAEFGELEPGEVAIFPSSGKSRVILRVDGSAVIEVEAGQEILARSTGGVAGALATKADLDALAGWDEVHTHAGNGQPPAEAATIPAAAGTDVLKGE